MRQIKFRGKSVHSGEWVYGNLVFNKLGTAYILPEEEFLIDKVIQVDDETIGQFTGLKDKNGKDIYEGDVITATAVLESNDGYDSRFQVQGQVQYNDEYSAFAFTNYIKSPVEQYAALLYQLDQETIEVIGNIHDNPDLL